MTLPPAMVVTSTTTASVALADCVMARQMDAGSVTRAGLAAPKKPV